MKTVLLGDVANFVQGIQIEPDRQYTTKKSGYVRFIRIVDFTKENEPKRYILDPGERYKINADDVAMIRYGSQTAGRVVTGLDGAIANNLFKINYDKTVLVGKYLYYLLSQKKIYISLNNSQSSSTMPAITFSQISKLKIPLPPIITQRKIVNILDRIDEKIELNQSMNETLEQIGQAFFKHYFIDDPKAKNWEVKSLDQVASFLNGLAMQKYPDNGGPTLPVIKIREMSNGITTNTDIASAEIPEKYIVHDGDILFSWSGTLIVKPWCGGDGALNQHLFKVTSVDYPKWFYYYWTNHHLQSFIVTAAGKATTMGHIQRKHLTAAKVAAPSEPELIYLNKIFAPILDSQISNEIENRTLINLRDSLLPRLISGKIKV